LQLRGLLSHGGQETQALASRLRGQNVEYACSRMPDPFAKVVCGFLKSVQQVAAENSAAAFTNQKEAVEELRGGVQKSKGALNWALPLLETMVKDMRRIVRCPREALAPLHRARKLWRSALGNARRGPRVPVAPGSSSY